MKKRTRAKAPSLFKSQRDESAFSNNQAEQNNEADNSTDNSEKTAVAAETNSNNEPQQAP